MQAEEPLRKLAARVLKELKAQKCRVEIFVVPAMEIKRLERRHLGTHKREVEVLSFPESGTFPEPEHARQSLGEIFLNGNLTKKAPARLQYLLLHAVLHLLGYSHAKKSDRIRMLKKEKELCAKFGILAPS